MGQMIRLTAPDGHEFEAYESAPAGAARGGLVVAMEMYGLTDYILSVCEYWAGHGYHAIAPALFDRLGPGIIVEYTEAGNKRGKELYPRNEWEDALTDLATAADHVRGGGTGGKVGIMGFCYGGSLAWLAACRPNFDAAVSYYGTNIVDFADETPNCPVMCNIGEADNVLPPERIAILRAAHPDLPIHIYPGAQHGFDNEMRPARFDEAAMKLARERSLEFLTANIG